jgi:energy-coupling factor transporter ATP-binding protein EcfA2
MNTKHSFRPWPEWPYRGLNYYRLQDQALLAGRDRDTIECSTLLAHPETRVLLLHGMTGCGKSSFMRAGLIPTMEGEGAGYLFLKTPDADDEALFIRCTDTPMGQIARQVFLFAEMPFPLRTPTGNQEVDLTDALLGKDTWEDYLAAAGDEGEVLLESLSCIARKIPKTLVLIVDQAEEVLTLNVSEEGLPNRARFFRFLRDFKALGFDARIIVALRTEFYGRFIDALQVDKRAAEFKQFLLSDLPRAALIEAIVRPTRQEALGSFGAPYDVYKFSFEPGLPEKIASDILSAKYTGAALPVLQLVCNGLYTDVVKSQGQPVIMVKDYKEKKGIEGQIMNHLTKVIRLVFVKESIETEARIRKLLSLFYSIQDDGTVVSVTRDSVWVRKTFDKDLNVPSDKLISAFVSPENLILRRIKAVKPDGKTVEELTLGHDSIALAIEQWSSLDAEIQLNKNRAELRLKTITAALSLFFMVTMMTVTYTFLDVKPTWYTVVAMASGLVASIFATFTIISSDAFRYFFRKSEH